MCPTNELDVTLILNKGYHEMLWYVPTNCVF